MGLWHNLVNRVRKCVLKAAEAQQRQYVLAKLRSVGAGFECDPSAEFSFPGRISIGNFVFIAARVQLYGCGGIDVGDHCILGPETVVMSSMHNYKSQHMVPYDNTELLKPVVIDRCVWIGFRAIIMPGVHLAEGCIVGAGSVVTKSCSPGSIVAGNPARIIGQRDMDDYRRCVASGQFYLQRKRAEQLIKREVLAVHQGLEAIGGTDRNA